MNRLIIFSLALTSLYALPSSAFAPFVSGQTVRLDWTVSWIENVNPDGAFNRKAIGVNGRWPPPTVNANIGDILEINLKNELQTGTSLHLHGIFQRGTNNMDGASLITQCVTGPGQSFKYQILVQQVGTYWWHGHFDGQYVDGFRGPVIFHAPDDKQRFGYDEDYVVPLAGNL
jgi:iron transport multicopper oxidase